MPNNDTGIYQYYEIKVTIGGATYDMRPYNIDQVRLKETKLEKYYDRVPSIEGDLYFYGTDFRTIYDHEQSPERCEPFFIDLYDKDRAGNLELLYRFSATCDNATFDLEGCTVIVKMDMTNPINQLEETGDVEVDIMNLQRKDVEITAKLPSSYAVSIGLGEIVHYDGMGIPFADVITKLVNDATGLTVKSNFFYVNPDDPSWTRPNPVSGMYFHTANLMFIQLSDAIQPDATGHATKGVITWNNLWGALQSLFNVSLAVERENGIPQAIRIEHVSYFDTLNVFDPMTAPDANKTPYTKQFLQLANGYTYDDDERANREEWKISYTPDASYRALTSSVLGASPDFPGYPIVYDNGCTKIGQTNVITHVVPGNITADIANVYHNKDLMGDGNTADLDGWCLLSLDGANGVMEIDSILLPEVNTAKQANNVLSMACLHKYFWLDNRYYKNGILNNQATTFKTVRRRRKGFELSLPVCETERLLEQYNAVKTLVGDGLMTEVSHDLARKLTTITPYYRAYDNDTPPPSPNMVYARVAYENADSENFGLCPGNVRITADVFVYLFTDAAGTMPIQPDAAFLTEGGTFYIPPENILKTVTTKRPNGGTENVTTEQALPGLRYITGPKTLLTPGAVVEQKEMLRIVTTCTDTPKGWYTVDYSLTGFTLRNITVILIP